MGVRKTNCRGRLARSGTVAGSFWHLANALTIRVLQICARRTRINISPAEKTDLPFRITSSYCDTGCLQSPLVKERAVRLDRLPNLLLPAARPRVLIRYLGVPNPLPRWSHV